MTTTNNRLRLPALVAALLASAAAFTVATRDATRTEAAAAATTAKAAKKSIPYAGDLFIETNATDGDAGIHLNLDGPDWNRLEIIDPRGRTITKVKATSMLRGYGLTGITFESAEPGFKESPFREFRRRFPEGRYTFLGRTVDGGRLVGADRFSHKVPKKPRILFPAKGAEVERANFVVRWAPVTGKGIEIVRYLVIVQAEKGEFKLNIELGRSATSVTVPSEFLKAGRYVVEVLARERGGNQTIAENRFRIK